MGKLKKGRSSHRASPYCFAARQITECLKESAQNFNDVSFCSTAPTDMRYSTDLCKEEKKFIQKRKEFVFEAMRTFLGHRGPQTIEEVSEKIEIGFMNITITMTGL